jgi:hypothetical protein
LKILVGLFIVAGMLSPAQATVNKAVSATPTLDTSAYASLDHVGTVMTFSNIFSESKGTAVVKTVTVVDKAKQSAALTLHLFNASPTLVSVDNAALDIADATLFSNYIGHISIPAANYIALNANSVATVNTELLLQGASAHLYGILESAGSPTYGVADLQVTLAITREN